MKKLLLIVGIAVGALLSGCETMERHIPKEKDDFSILGGLVAKKEAAFEEVRPTQISVKAGSLSRDPKYTGDRVSILWGLITIVDE
ncbi:MAG: hypothetical protein AAGB46_19325 [Verrucomicrobiota bacterium]